MSIPPVMQRLADKLKRTDLPEFVPGDQVRVQVKIKEGEKERIQPYEGVVIALSNKGSNRSFNVRKISHGVGVERMFLVSSPKVGKYAKAGGAYYQRGYTGGLVLISPNQTGNTVNVQLGGTYYLPDGRAVTQVSLPQDTAQIVTTTPP